MFVFVCVLYPYICDEPVQVYEMILKCHYILESLRSSDHNIITYVFLGEPSFLKTAVSTHSLFAHSFCL